MKKIDSEEFVRVWQLASSRKEVVEKFQMTEEKVSDRAAYLRRHGVQLKKFVKGEQLDYKKIE